MAHRSQEPVGVEKEPVEVEVDVGLDTRGCIFGVISISIVILLFLLWYQISMGSQGLDLPPKYGRGPISTSIYLTSLAFFLGG